jgi:hypothetical protein
MIIAFCCIGFFEILFFILYRNTRKRLERLKGSGRMYEIVHTKHWEQFFKIIVIFLPILALLFVNEGLLAQILPL